MKIKNYILYQVPPRWPFLKIETDEGITGWREPAGKKFLDWFGGIEEFKRFHQQVIYPKNDFLEE